MLEGENQHVFLTRSEYEELVVQAQRVEVEDKSPQSHVLLSADYETRIRNGRAAMEGLIRFEVMSDDLLGIALPLRGMSLRSALLDGTPAPLGRRQDGLPELFVRGRGKHELKLDMFVPIEVTAAQQAMRVQLITPASTQWKLTVPGNVEIKSGTAVMRRSVDEVADVTEFDLVAPREETTLVMSLNNRIRMRERVVLARSVLLDELTESYERLHASVSLAIPHGAVDQFRFELPAGFEVRDVATPLLTRWAVVAGKDQERLLEVHLREPTTDSLVLNILAERSRPAPSVWEFPNCARWMWPIMSPCWECSRTIAWLPSLWQRGI